jgi:hypothetical protein
MLEGAIALPFYGSGSDSENFFMLLSIHRSQNRLYREK